MGSFEDKLSTVRQTERELCQNSKQAGPEDATVTRLRSHMSLLYQECILEYPTEAHAENLDASWWRHCFHAPIDYYRRFLKSSKTPEGRWAISEVNRLIDSGFGAFTNMLHSLISSSGNGIEDDTKAQILETLGLPFHSGGLSVKTAPAVAQITYRCLIFCGDLARYRCQFNRAFTDDRFQLAWRIYAAARQLEPDYGHACNQLAVIASLSGDTLLTVFWYLRALSCQYPFLAARDNLQAFLEKILESNDRVNELGESGNWRPFLSLVQTSITEAGSAIDFCFEGMAQSLSIKEQAFVLFIILMLVKLFGVDKLLIEKFLLTLPTKSVVDHSEGLVSLIVALFVSIGEGFEQVGEDCRTHVLERLLDHQNIFLNADTRLQLDELSGFDLVESLHLAGLVSDQPLIKSIVASDYPIPGIKLKDDQLILIGPRISTPRDASSPLILFAPPSSEQPSQKLSSSYNSSEEEVDEIVLFQGLKSASKLLEDSSSL